MKHLTLRNLHYRYIIELYADWLTTLGYSYQTVHHLPIYLREFLHYQESKGIYELSELNINHINAYYEYIKQRPNTRFKGGLSNASINNQRRMLRSFTDFLRQSGRMIIPALDIVCLDDSKEKLNTLTEQEIKALFKATYTIDDLQREGRPPLGSRDRAMLSVLYGCGLRRTEVIGLNIGDINSEQQSIFVSKGKNYKQRIVPVSPIYLNYIEEYIYTDRYTLLRGGTSDALLISQRSVRINDQSINVRLKKLTKHSGNEVLISKNPSLHTLRHSIATHLLHSGVQLEHIAQFLGHSSLESTQRYTQL